MILVGHIGHAHGIKGLVKLQSYTSPPEGIAGYEGLRLKDGTPIRLSVTPANGALLARIEGVSDRTQAERLRNAELYINRTEMPDTGPDEYYHADLAGLAVLGQAGEKLGNVVAVHNFGAGDILEIKPDGKASFMLPFNKAFVPTVDLAGRTLTIADYEESE